MTKKISKKELELIILQECILAEQELIVNELAEHYIQSLTEEQLQELTKADMVKTMGDIGRSLTPKIKDAGGKALKFAKDKLSPLAKDAADIGKAAFAGAKDEFDKKRAVSKYMKLAAQLAPLQDKVDLIIKQQARLAKLSPEVQNLMQQQITGRMSELTGKETAGKTLDNIQAQAQAILEPGEQGEGGEANAEKEQATSAPSEQAQQATPKAPDEEQEVDDKDIVSSRKQPNMKDTRASLKNKTDRFNRINQMQKDRKAGKGFAGSKLEEEITEAVIQNILKLKDK